MQKQGLDAQTIIQDERILPPSEFDKYLTMELQPSKGEKMNRNLYVIKPVCITAEQEKKPRIVPKIVKTKKIYNQLLQNHARPPGPWNRGEVSALLWDKRPLDVQIGEQITDVEPYRADRKEFGEIEDLMATQYGKVDEIFYEQQLLNLFEQTTDEAGRVKPRPAVQIYMQKQSDGYFWGPRDKKDSERSPDKQRRLSPELANQISTAAWENTPNLLPKDRKLALEYIHE